MPNGTAVVGHEYDERFFIDPVLFERLQDFAGRPIDLLHRVAPFAVGRFAGKPFAGELRPVRHGVRQVEKKRLGLVLLDEPNSLCSVTLGEQTLVRLLLNHLLHPQQRQRRITVFHATGPAHVVGKRDAKVILKPMPCRQKLRLIAKVPLAHDRRRIAAGLEHLRHGGLLRVQPTRVAGKEHPAPGFVFMQTHTLRIATGHQRGTRRGTNATRHVKRSKFPPLGGHMI